MPDSPANKIVFVTPPYHYGLADVMGRWIPLNFVYLAGAARQAGVEPAIYDALNLGHDQAEIEGHLRESGARYVACTANTSTVNEALKVLESAKRVNPATVTILGGVHPSFMYREVLEHAAVDYVVVGEGEATLRELLAALEGGGDPASVPGIACRVAGEVKRSARRPFQENLDELPAAWDLLTWELYAYQVMPGSRLGSISTSRGCDHDCTFCSQQQFWERSWRARDPEKVVDELGFLNRAYGVTVFQVTDEYPTRDPGRWERILDLLIERGLPVSLIIETRTPDIIRDRAIIGKYRKAGVVHVSLGAEGSEQYTLDYLKKGTTLDETREALELLKENGIVSELSFVLGFPEETPQSVAQTLKYAQSLNPDSANFMALTPWPYAPLYQELKELVRERNYDKYNLIDPVIEPRQMTLNQMEIALIDCFRKFYMGKFLDILTMKDEFRRGYMARATKIIMASPFVFKKFGQLVMGKVRPK